MNNKKKILILERDDFLREILGNLLHKKNQYILNGFSVQEGIIDAKNNNIDTVILGTSCPDYRGKETISYLKKNLVGSNIEFYIINHGKGNTDFVPRNQQFNIQNLSINDIVNTIAG